ncbi:MAG TPA: hypothetical protein VF381_11085 [Thermoanaerobaculia bacterium]
MNTRMTAPYWALRIGLGLGPLLAGLDKFFNILADWQMYLSPYATKVLPISPALFMRIVGVIEIVVGLIVLAGMSRIGGYILTIWLIGIAINLVTTGMFYDLAVRDVEISIAAFTLARLTEARAETSRSKRNERKNP